MTRTRADNVSRNDDPGPLHDSGVDCVSKVDGRPVRIGAAQIAQRREPIAHVFAREAQSFQRLACRGFESLPGEIGSIHSEVNMSVDESGLTVLIRKVDYFARSGGRSTDRPTLVMRFPSTRISIGPLSVSETPSNILPQSRTMLLIALFFLFALPGHNEPDLTTGGEAAKLMAPEMAHRALPAQESRQCS